MPMASQQALPVDRETFHAIRGRLVHPFDHESLETDDGFLVFVRSPSDEPDPVADLERAVEEMPPWLEARVAGTWLLGSRRTVHVPGHPVNALLADRARIDRVQAEDLRARLREAYDALLYRGAGDPMRRLRLGVRLGKARVAQLDEADLDGLAYATGHMADEGKHRHVAAVLLVADEDHLRLRARDYFSDVTERWRGVRRRPQRGALRPARAQRTGPTATNGFPAPSLRVDPVGPPRRHAVTVEPDLEIEVDVDAVEGHTPPDPSPVLDRLDRKRLELGVRLAAKVLRLNGFRVLRDVYNGRALWHVAASRASTPPRHVAVRVLDSSSRRDVDQLILDARALGADVVIGLCSDPAPALVERTRGTRVRLMRPEETVELSFQ
jgi:hypothetical protein